MGVRVFDPADAHIHQVMVFIEDVGLARAGLLLGGRRHPVNAIRGEAVQPFVPAALIENFRLTIEKLLDGPLGVGGDRHPIIYRHTLATFL